MDSQAFDSLSNEIMGEGHEVRWASDGKEACDLALGAELIFLDAALPIFNAFEVTAILRGDPDVPRDLPIFLLGDEAVDPHLFERSGFTGQFRKSHSYCDVRELLSSHLRVLASPP
jgi:CheY-like chemotaxis protein